jgi:hypothetical protein
MSAPTRGARSDDSSGRASLRPSLSGLSLASAGLLAAGLIGALLLVIADFSTLFEVKAVTAVLEDRTGGEHHTYALVLIGVLALPMAAGASLGGSRPAAVAVVVLALIALVIVFAVDLPDVNSTGLTKTFDEAEASPKTGFYLETLGAVLLLVAGVGNLLLGGRPEPPRRPSERSRGAHRPR